MTRSEIISCGIWTLIFGIISVPIALALGSGHSGSMVGAIFAMVFLMPASIFWMLVEPWGGSIIGGIAAACAQFAWLFFLVYLVKRWVSRRKRPNESQAS
jgi:hypothetical protein